MATKRDVKTKPTSRRKKQNYTEKAIPKQKKSASQNKRKYSSRTTRLTVMQRSQTWDKLGDAATKLGNKAFDATKAAGTAIAKGTISAGRYVGEVVKDDIAYHKELSKTRAKRIAFAKRNHLRIDPRPGYENVFYTMGGEVLIVDVNNPSEVQRAESALRGRLLGGGYTRTNLPVYGGRERVIVVYR